MALAESLNIFLFLGNLFGKDLFQRFVGREVAHKVGQDWQRFLLIAKKMKRKSMKQK